MFLNKERLFFNSTRRGMRMDDIIQEMKKFMNDYPYTEYKLVVGTDSQVVGKKTCFATAIILHRAGMGTWACIGKQIELRNIWSLHDKISKETEITYTTLHEITEKLQDNIIDNMVKYKNFSFVQEAHLDIGRKGRTRELINEMLGWFKGSGVTPKIKPYSYASYVANRYSKCI